MKRTVMVLVVLLQLSLASTLTMGPVQALSCASPKPPSEEFALSESVFRGTVTDKHKSATGNVATFKVHEVWKGNVSEQTELLESDMWLEFEQGKQYLIYMGPDQGERRANLCGNTKLWEQGKADVAAFGSPSTTLYGNERSNVLRWRVPVMAAAAALVVYSLIRLRRRERR